MKILIVVGLVILATVTVFLLLKKDKKSEQPVVPTPQPTPPAEY